MDTPGSDIKVGGTAGGFGTFLAGAALAAVSAWFFADSVRVTSGIGRGGYGGFISDRFGGSTGVVFLPLFIAVVWLFVNAKKPWPWAMLAIGIAVLAIEILSQLRFWFDLKLSHFLIMLFGFAAGIGMIIRSMREMPEEFLKS
ncbi:MAG: hypothetical protein ACR2NL_04960 [Acidimicrobiia bacterium]